MMSSSSSSSRIQIAHLNNEGSARIEAGDLEGGLTCLRAALSTTKALISQEHSESSQATVRCSLDKLITFERNSAESGSGVEERSFLVRPAKIQTSSPEVMFEEGNATILSMIIVFNMAVIKHITAMKDGDAVLLQHAIQLYECTLNLQNSYGQRLCCNGTVFRLVLLHNLGHAHSALGDKVTADHLYKQLLSALMYVVNTHQMDTAGVSPFGDNAEYIRSFFGTTYHLMCPTSSNAASAA